MQDFLFSLTQPKNVVTTRKQIIIHLSITLTDGDMAMRTILAGFVRRKFNIFLCISVLLSLFAVSIHSSSAIAEPTVITTISVGSGPVRVGVNSSTNRIYVANNSSNTVSVIEDTTNTVLSTILVGSIPFGVGVNSSTNLIYVANYSSNTVSVIEDAPSTTIPTPSITPLPTTTPSQTPAPGGSGVVFGFVYNADEESLKNVTVNITSDTFSDSTTTDEDGYYEFSGLKEGDYTLTYEKEGYQTYTEDISLGEGEEMDMGRSLWKPLKMA